jgi:hypothetical protein
MYQRGPTRLMSVSFVIRRLILKTCPEAPKFVKIEHKYRAIYTKTYVGFTAAGDMHLP